MFLSERSIPNEEAVISAIEVPALIAHASFCKAIRASSVSGLHSCLSSKVTLCTVAMALHATPVWQK